MQLDNENWDKKAVEFKLSNGRHVKVQIAIREFPGSVKVAVAVGKERGNIVTCSNEDSYYTEE